jgi:hypothetical protein
MKRFLLLFLASGAIWAQSAGTPMSLISIIDDNLLPNGGKVGGSCTNYNVAYFNVVLGHSVACVNTNPLNVTNVGVWTVTGGGGGGSSYLAGAGLTLTGTTFSVKYGTTATTATEGNDARIGAGGTTYTAGTGLTLTGNAFSVNYGTTATTSAAGNDSRIVNALNSSSPLNATNLTTGTVPSGRLPVPTASTLGGVQSLACAASSHVNSIGTDGLPTCTADTGGAGTTYTAGTGLTLTGNAFSVNYGTTATTAAVGNDTRIVNALNSSSSLNATILLTVTMPAARMPVPTASTLGGVQSLSCAASSHLNAISTAGVPTCTADATGGATSVPIGGSSARRPATTPGTSSLFLQTDRNVGDQFSYYNGTAWYYPGAVDATMTRDAATGTMGVNPNSVPRLGAVNNFTASNVITSPGGIPLQLASTSPKTTLYVTNTNSTSAGTHDWDISSDTTGGFLIYDDTSNATIFARSADGTATYVSGGLVVNTSNLVKPTCAVGVRGMLWYVNGGAAADSYQACLYNGTAYTWRTITIP